MTKYYGVIGNRDHIKIKGEKRPFWEFLDVMPDGWLSSLVYARKDVPEGQMIWDCGAWSYKNEVVPTWNANTVIPEYERLAPDGSMVIAPDHMLIGDDLDSRRAFNLESAERFIDSCPDRFTPMGAVHGTTAEERVEVAHKYVGFGYTHLALGSMAANAARKKMVLEHVGAVRDAVPNAYIHILGLSSPRYMREWARNGIQSCDGSSHFKQAFTGGAFFTRDGEKLTKHQAARPGNADCAGIVAPECDCKCCTILRGEGIDTRTFGSNEHNMGRAAHNLNMLMLAQKSAMRRHIVLVACCGEKLPYAAPAKDLYQSSLFKKARRYSEKNGESWLILSAKHGVLHPDEIVEPYDQTLTGMSLDIRIEWSKLVATQLNTQEKYTVLAGKNYCGWIDGFEVSRPMKGLGIGQQLAWLTENTHEDTADLFGRT